MQVVPFLVQTAGSIPNPTPAELAKFDPKVAFASLKFDDLWSDAGMPELLVWLRGNKALRVPDEWRSFLPSVLARDH